MFGMFPLRLRKALESKSAVFRLLAREQFLYGEDLQLGAFTIPRKLQNQERYPAFMPGVVQPSLEEILINGAVFTGLVRRPPILQLV